MFCLRGATALTASLAVAGGVCLLTASAASAAGRVDARTLLAGDGLTVQVVDGWVGASGDAADVTAASAALRASGIGSTAVFTEAGSGGEGFLVITGDGLPTGTTFQVLNLNAAGAADNSDESDVFYKLTTGERGETVAAGTHADLAPDGTVFAAYPANGTPPPNDRGLDPVARFTWSE